MKKPFKWDDYSDQPSILQDKTYKKQMRKREFISLAKTFFTSLVVLPFSLIAMPYVKRKEVDSNYFFSMGVDFQREPEESLKLLEELEVNRVLLRFKLWEMDSLDELKSFVEKLGDKKIILKIMQDRENVEDLDLFRNNLHTIFKALGEKIDIYEIDTKILIERKKYIKKIYL